ncbi:MAG: hypothetical protein KatS3mg115_1457 [Candidatus Poribacteria bacterium]|nr:MAG: hypothetical protein KatS3mg115_1457 [Candidatus Poribacteria bacterium]
MRAWAIPLVLLANVVLTVAAQSLLRHGMMTVSLPESWRMGEIVPAAVRVAFNPSVLLGLLLFVGSLILWLFLLARVPLGRLYPIQQSFVFLGIQWTAWRWLGESPGWGRLVGIALIVFGVFLVSRSS